MSMIEHDRVTQWDILWNDIGDDCSCPKDALRRWHSQPDLLLACRELLDQIEADREHLMGDHEGMLDSPEIMDLVKMGQAAIAKAERGEA